MAVIDKIDRTEHPRVSEALGVLLLALSLATLLSLLSYDPLDPAWNVASARMRAFNWIGSFGAWLSDGLFQLFGLSAFLIPVLLTAIGWRTLRLRELKLLRRRFIGLLLLLISLGGLLSLPQMPLYRENVRFGGALGYLLANLLEMGFNKVGTAIALSVVLIFSVMLATEFSFNSLLGSGGARSLLEWIIAAELGTRRYFSHLRTRWRERAETRRQTLAAKAKAKAEAKAEARAAREAEAARQESTSRESARTTGVQKTPAPTSRNLRSQASRPANQAAPEPPPEATVQPPVVSSRSGRDMNELRKLVYGEDDDQGPLQEFSLTGQVKKPAPEWEVTLVSMEIDQDAARGQESIQLPVEAIEKAKPQPPPIRRRFDTLKVPGAAAAQAAAPKFSGDPAINEMLESASIGRVSEEKSEPVSKAGSTRAAAMASLHNFKLPDLEYLTKPPIRQEQADEELWERARLLAEKCKEFSVAGKIQHISPGPVVTTFEFKPDPGVKYSRVTSLVDDLCLALKAESIRIDRIPGKSTVGIEVPNIKRELIYLREILESDKYRGSLSPLSLALGKTIDGTTYVADLTRMPHLLIAGATGTGKSVCLNSIIVSILYKSTPEDVKMIMVDPKRLELGLYEGIPHLLTPIVLDPKRASNALKWAVSEMENRYKMLAGHGVRNIEQYNLQVREKRRQRIAEQTDDLLRPLPYIVIIIDELADLMMVASTDVETSITRLAQMARAVGIHLIIATQRPSVDVITGLIKANFPSRISFRVSSKVDSRTILDTNGAETLLGQGDMLFLPPGTSRLVRVHGAYVGEAEIGRVMEYIRQQGQPAYDESIQISEEEAEINEAGIGIKDELYEEALRIVCQMGRASTSVLQRRLRIGYGRAAAILDMMEREAFVGPSDGSKPRVVKQEAYDYIERLDQLKEE
jgi:DNA segregation ATPase FtsK/SpoIIIE, S-DNA-T family